MPLTSINNNSQTLCISDLFSDLVNLSEINHAIERSFLIDTAIKFGWTLSTREGKGSHYKLKQDGYQSIIVHSHEYYPSATRQILRRIIQPKIDQITQERYVNHIIIELENLLETIHNQVSDVVHTKAQVAYAHVKTELQKNVETELQRQREEHDEHIKLELDALEKLRGNTLSEVTYIKELQERVQELEGFLRRIQTWRQINYKV